MYASKSYFAKVLSNKKNKSDDILMLHSALSLPAAPVRKPLLVPADRTALDDDNVLNTVMLSNLRQNITDGINARFERLLAKKKGKNA